MHTVHVYVQLYIYDILQRTTHHNVNSLLIRVLMHAIPYIYCFVSAVYDVVVVVAFFSSSLLVLQKQAKTSTTKKNETDKKYFRIVHTRILLCVCAMCVRTPFIAWRFAKCIFHIVCAKCARKQYVYDALRNKCRM